uniref:Uncharacterized protein n=1 Tax=Magnetospirillum gryphiswaldense TaxID=55518 RepID=A4TV78_9PROT|nr:hypothetical protein MGR_0100 [Magnetospirillum gryphiswaldense MSR-1]
MALVPASAMMRATSGVIVFGKYHIFTSRIDPRVVLIGRVSPNPHT